MTIASFHATTLPNPSPSRRILSLHFPRLPSDRVWRGRLGSAWRQKAEEAHPLLLSCRENNTQRIFALDDRAEALGLKRGMGLAEARALHPHVDVVQADPVADALLLDQLADWCDRYTPLVAIDNSEGLLLDITGCVHLFGSEEKLLADLVCRLNRNGFTVHAGIASCPGAAWAASRFNNGAIIADGAEAAFLAPLPLGALRLPSDTVDALESVGLRRIHSLINAPRAPLARRFGKMLLLRLDQALGKNQEAVSPRRPVAVLTVDRPLPEPIGLIADIEAMVPLLAKRLETEMIRRGEGARSLELTLFRVDGAISRIALSTSRPLRDAGGIKRLFREKLGAIGDVLDPGYGLDLIRLSVTDTGPMVETQESLASAERSGAEGDLALFADRIAARLGRQALLHPSPVQSHIPEAAVRLLPFGEGDGAAIQVNPASVRPVRLLRSPERVDVIAEIPEGPPSSFRWRRATHQVTRSEGPERLAPEWWKLPALLIEDEEKREAEERERQRSLTRDYYRIEDRQGLRFWLFREGYYGGELLPRWFMHGLFA